MDIWTLYPAGSVTVSQEFWIVFLVRALYSIEDVLFIVMFRNAIGAIIDANAKC